MKIGQLIQTTGYSISFEFFPPKDVAGEKRLFEVITSLSRLNPTFVSVTYGAGGGTSKNTKNIILRIKRETSLEPMPHLTCVDQNQNELKAILEDYKAHGIENVLALRGDPPKDTAEFVAPTGGFCYAKDLVKLTSSVGGFSIGVAAYPEGHIESPSLESDMLYTKQKVDSGADFVITQMFFDNRFYYDLLERAEKLDMHIPIIPGIMPILNIDRIRQFSGSCGSTVPAALVKRFEKVNPSSVDAKRIGIEIVTEQCVDLMRNGIRYFHFYTLNQSEAVIEIVNNLGLSNTRGNGNR